MRSALLLLPLVTDRAGLPVQLEGNLVKWQKWQFRLGFNYREGVVLHNVGCAPPSLVVLNHVETALLACGRLYHIHGPTCRTNGGASRDCMPVGSRSMAASLTWSEAYT